ncbi:hypothetical protein LTS18_004998 [Coniosporium uncinatum]|uniref:Uncharacterized protein n=1 Tax=Coniosporium uncinatum TaxID=93489 RepID=A0ACC3DS67_9PEZI|nr:hypothetical protein LTS18_004998 [Coniosporium uncinatum]
MIVCLDLYHTQEAERHGRRASSDVAFDWNDDRRASMIAAIDSSVHIWEGLRDHSMEAFKAHATLTVMLQKLREHEGMRHRRQQQHQQQSLQQQQNYAQAAQAFPATANGVSGGVVDGMADDDPNVAPEHSAAMTLGMLSTGALTPNAGMMFDGAKGYATPYGDPTQQQSSGLTPNYSGPGNDGPGGAANAQSPFSQLFGAGIGFQSMDALGGVGGNLDWDAWDSYIQGTNLDGSANQMWANMNVDQPTPMQMPDSSDPISQQQQGHGQQQQSNGAYPGGGGGGVFMGVSTPPNYHAK